MGLIECLGAEISYRDNNIEEYKHKIYNKINKLCDKIYRELKSNKKLNYHTKKLIYSINVTVLKSITKCLF